MCNFIGNPTIDYGTDFFESTVITPCEKEGVLRYRPKPLPALFFGHKAVSVASERDSVQSFSMHECIHCRVLTLHFSPFLVQEPMNDGSVFPSNFFGELLKCIGLQWMLLKIPSLVDY